MTEMQTRVLRALRRLVKKHNRPIRRCEIEASIGQGRLDGYLKRMVAAGTIQRLDFGGYLPSGVRLELGP